MSTKLASLFKQIAPDYPYQALLAHLSAKFSQLDTNEFELRLSECLKFLYLRSLSGCGFIPLAGEVDAFWHEMILQTREYAAFCEALPSGEFIHHNSISLQDHAEKITKEQEVMRLLEWIPAYVQHFGHFNEETAKYWVIVKLLQCEFHYSLDDINQLV
ncbi:hypothetical protein [Legionella sp. W05-934-2]|jgi:hypothetical protein|uniref:hypothetical protein n=1 Tax=Legionella sp. W05-934-2 TaxID=1198649 RepID=UPI00346287C1